MLAPIALFTYNRPEHLKKTVESLAKNTLAKESMLFVFSDGPKTDSEKEVREVRTYLNSISGFKEMYIVERETNVGLANSIIVGVTELVNKYGKIIVLEDDLVTSPHFLAFMNTTLDMYENEDKVGSVHGYVYPVKTTLPETFFMKHTSSWGWGTWKRAWNIFEPNGQKLLEQLKKRDFIKEFNFGNTYDYSGMLQRQIDGKNNSWAIRWYASLFLSDKLSLYPGKSFIQNIGQDGSGTHMGASGKYYVYISENAPVVEKIKIEKNEYATKAVSKFYKSFKPSIFSKVMRKFKKIIHQ